MSHQGFVSRLSEQEREQYERKVAAAEFYRFNKVPEEVEAALNQLFLLQPDDIFGHLANHFAKLAGPPRLHRLKGREVYDTRGQLSVDVEVFCILHTKEQRICSAGVSSCSRLKGFSDGDAPTFQEWAEHVRTAIQWVDEHLTDILMGHNLFDQSGMDHALSEFFTTQYHEHQDFLKKKQEQEAEEEEKGDEEDEESECEDALPAAGQTKAKKIIDTKVKKTNGGEKPSLKPVLSIEPPEPAMPGSLAIGSVSLAVALSGAQIQGVPLYKYIAALKNQETPIQFHIPICLVTLMSCGKTSPGKLSLMEEVILIPKPGMPVRKIITVTSELQTEIMKIMNTSAKAGVRVIHESGAPSLSLDKPEQPLELITEASSNLGLELGAEIHLAVNCAAFGIMDYSKGKYEVATGISKSPDELVDMYQNLVSKFPAVIALINPFRKEDKEQWEKLSTALGDSCSVLFDNTAETKCPSPPGVSGCILKHLYETTISDLVHVTLEQKGSLLMGVASNESCNNDCFSDIAVGLGLDYIKLGGLIGAERISKYNRLISIEEELAQQGILVSTKKHSPPLPVVKLGKEQLEQEEDAAATAALTAEPGGHSDEA